MPHTLSKLSSSAASSRVSKLLKSARHRREKIRKRKEKEWKLLWDLVSDFDDLWWQLGLGSYARFEIDEYTNTNVKTVKRAMKYGWICRRGKLRPVRFGFELEYLPNLQCYLKTENFLNARRCVRDEEFLKKNKEELKEFRLLIVGSDDESSDEEED